MDILTFPQNASKNRLAIVSTFNELCGIAGYTKAIFRQLSPHLDVKVFDLDQYLMRGQFRRLQKLADLSIKNMAAEFHNFDSVNIQLEHGTLGRSPRKVLRRFKILAKSSPALSVTFHTVMKKEKMPWGAIFGQAIRGRVNRSFSLIGDNLRSRLLGIGIYSYLRRLQRHKNVSIIVHTKRDMQLLSDVYRLKNVYHHPLSYVSSDLAQSIRATSSRNDFPVLHQLDPKTKLIGTFGFLSHYKGFETAIEALQQLPEDYHLLVFGGIHPQSIRREQPLDPYIKRLLKTAKINQTILDQINETGARTAPSGDPSSLIGEHPKSLRSRMHFMGSLPDDKFMSAMAICDAVVVPYLEVGQSSSGPISMALEMGCRVLASRTLAFLQFDRYHPGQVEFFDIGNFIELAGLLKAAPSNDCTSRQLTYNTYTNTQLYLKANWFINQDVDANQLSTMKLASEQHSAPSLTAMVVQ